MTPLLQVSVTQSVLPIVLFSVKGLSQAHSYHLKDWVQGWVPQSVFSLGNGVSSVQAWFSTALDIAEVSSGAGSDQLNVMVADVIKSFDTVDRSILDCAPGRLGSPHGSGKCIFLFNHQVRLMFKLASGVGEPWCRDGSIPQRYPLSMVFVVSLYVPWCRRLESMPSIRPQLYADDLMFSSACPNALFGAARVTVQYVRSVGQDVSPAKCVLLNTSKAVRKSMKLWDVSGDGRSWTNELDVRGLGGHLDFTRRAMAGSPSRSVEDAAHGVAAVGVLPLVPGFAGFGSRVSAGWAACC